MKEIGQSEFKQWIKEGKNYQLIDVRENHEYDEFNIGGERMPLSEFPKYIENIKKDIPVVVQCRSGARSAQAIMHLSSEHGYTNLINLKGGILNWENA